MFNRISINNHFVLPVIRFLMVAVFLMASILTFANSQGDSLQSSSFARPHLVPPPPAPFYQGRSINAGLVSNPLDLNRSVSSDVSSLLGVVNVPLVVGLESSPYLTSKVEQSQFYIYFEVNSFNVNTDFMDNGSQCVGMLDFLNGLQHNPQVIIDSIVVYGASSPEGDMRHNEQLALSRCNSVKRYISDNFLSIDTRKILTYSRGEDWSGLRLAVESDSEVPNKSEVLDILDLSSNRENREFFLRRLDNGRSWRYLSDHILPYLRSGVSSKVYYRESPSVGPPSEESHRKSLDFIPYVSSSPSLSRIKPKKLVNDTVFIYSKPDTIDIVRYIKDTLEVSVVRPLWSLKTNLLYWAALQPNIEVEFYFGNHWSLNFEYQIAWWKNSSKHQYYQYTQCGPEGRYWFKGDGNFRGHYVGLHVGFGIYDLSWGNGPDYQGYQGEFAIALGLSYGYVWKLGKILHLEAGLGFGYVMTEYRRYRYIDQCYVYQGTERMQFLGPTKARLALQWRIGSGVLGGKKKRGVVL